MPMGAKWEHSGHRQLKQRKVSIFTSEFSRPTPDVKFLLPYVHELIIDESDFKLVASVFDDLPKLDYVSFEAPNNEVHEGLDKIVSIRFCHSYYVDEKIKPILRMCSENLHYIYAEGNNKLEGSFLDAASVSLRGLFITETHFLRMRYVLEYLNKNRLLFDLSLETANGTIDLVLLYPYIRGLVTLELLGNRTLRGFAELAKLEYMTRLDIEITCPSFKEYPLALNDESWQKLKILHLSMEFVTVSSDFAKSFEKFIHLEVITIFVGKHVNGANFLVPHLNYLAKCAKLKTVYFAGYTNDNALWKTCLPDVQQFRVCGISCGCPKYTHAVIKYRFKRKYCMKNGDKCFVDYDLIP